MSSAHDDLLRRADEQLAKSHPWLAEGYVPIIRDLRDALVAASTLPDAVRADIRLMTRSVGKHSLDDNALDAADRLDAFLAAHQPLERASEQPATSRADVSSTSLADRGSNESALRAKIEAIPCDLHNPGINDETGLSECDSDPSGCMKRDVLRLLSDEEFFADIVRLEELRKDKS